MPNFLKYDDENCEFEVLSTSNNDIGNYILIQRTVYSDFEDTW